MDFETISAYAWIAWLVLIALFLVIEIFTLEFTFLMLAVGSVGGLIASAMGLPLWAAVIVAAATSIALIFVLKPQLLIAVRRGADHAPSNVERLIGMQGMVVSTVTPTGGQVKLSNGDTWTARSQSFALPPQTPVTVTSIEGAIAHVSPVGAPTRTEGTPQ